MNYSIDHIKEIIKGDWLCKGQNQAIEHLVTDSRKIIFPDTSLFFALPGRRRDGYHFLKELYDRGLRNFVVAKKDDISYYSGANLIFVDNTLRALQLLAAYHRSQFDIPVIAITGSNGKTIVKEWLNQLLEDRFGIVRSPKSYNSQLGVPLSVWEMNEASELGIFEAGISRSGEMKKLHDIIRPTMGIFTNIGQAHSEGFTSKEKKAQEKLKLFNNATVLVYGSDDQDLARQVRPWARKQGVDLFSWGKAKGSRLRILSIKKADKQTAILFEVEGRKQQLQIPFTDQASLQNVMHCITLMAYLGADLDGIQAKLLRLKAVAMRLELQSGINHCSIINDSYTADLNSLAIALDFLSQQHQHAKRTVILSDIPQTGMEEKKLYRELARLLAQKKINRLLAIGERLCANESLIAQHMKADMHFFHSTEAFISLFPQLSFRDETILLKGARVFQFEKIDHLLAQQAHQTILEIDLNAMAYNITQYQKRLRPSTKLMAMVKAFGYGTGSFEIANLLQFHKIDYLAVAYADEGVELRKAGISIPIMVMNVEENSYEALLQFHLEPVIYSFKTLKAIDHFLRDAGIPLMSVHIEIDTGMNRLGFRPEQAGELGRGLASGPFKVQTVFSHLAAGEEQQQDEFTRQQAIFFEDAAKQLEAALSYPFLRHLANTAAIVRFPLLQLDMVRLGIGLYGIDSASCDQIELKEVATLKSTIAQIRTVKRGETVGYNRKGVANENLSVATVRIGYADGFPRSLGNGAGKMWLKGRLAPTIGTVCMDMTMIDITGMPDVEEGDEVVLFGPQLSVQRVARWAQTIPYEMLTGISHRVKRIYFQD